MKIHIKKYDRRLSEMKTKNKKKTQIQIHKITHKNVVTHKTHKYKTSLYSFCLVGITLRVDGLE